MLLGVIVLLAIWNREKLTRLYHVNHLFDKEVITNNFQHMEEIFDVTQVAPSTSPYSIPRKLDFHMPASFAYKGESHDVKQFLEESMTEGLMIIHNDTLIYEQYSLGLTPSETHISWSMSKSVIATIIGMMVDENKLKLTDLVTDYLPQFKDTGYEQVSIKDLLQMSSGVKFDEDYGDFNSDINRFGRAFAMGSSLESFALSLVNERKPGTYNHYVSIDTQMLGLILRKLSGQSITELLENRIWEPLRMQDQASWIVDNRGVEVALGGLNATLRDYAKLGLLYLHRGQFAGKRVVSAQWIDESTTPLDAHVQPNQTHSSSNLFGYGYQWWTPQRPDGDYFAAGIYDQFIYVNPKKNLVVVKLSADYRYRTDRKRIKDQHVVFFQDLAGQFSVDEDVL